MSLRQHMLRRTVAEWSSIRPSYADPATRGVFPQSRRTHTPDQGDAAP
jgi:hypothetical protein